MSLFLTRSEAFSVGRRAMASRPGIKINPAVIDIPGSDLNVVTGMFSVIGEEVSSRGAAAMRGLFAELARGSQLDKVIYDRSGLLRFSDQEATVDLVLARPLPGAPTPGTYSSGSVVQTPDGVQFGLMADAVFGNFDTTKLVSAQALVAGSEGNVPAYDPVLGLGISVFSTAPFDPTLTVQNPKSAAGGTPAETDIQFLGRYRSYFPTLSKGVLGAIEYGAQQVPGVAVATATEVVNPFNGFPAEIVQLVIGDLNGNASGTMITAVSDSLLKYRAAGITVVVLGGTVFYQGIQWHPTFLAGYNESLIRDRLRAVFVAVSQFLPPGPERGGLLTSSLISAAKRIPGLVVTDASLVYPLGDVIPTTQEEMIRVLPASVTFV
jgi:hypothetical protein